ncbi:hypothetical protein ABZ570_03850 [Micromonospora sp. NPDC007271]|uniref:ApeA N-terminal domain 1-containing protein n=1 Tax=Micromonospora sp. NPDC007271 TaxID=3154587 RepID=UPI0033D47B2D
MGAQQGASGDAPTSLHQAWGRAADCSRRQDLGDNRLVASGVPLKPRLEPGQYGGEWLIPNQDGLVQRVGGDLELSAGRPPSVAVWGDVPLHIEQHPNGLTSAAFPQRFSYPLLVGELRNGLKVILVEAEVSTWQLERAIVSARAALVGPPSGSTEGPLLVSKIGIQISGLDAFSGIGPLKSFSHPQPGEGFYDHTWQVSPNPDCEQRWSDDHVALRFGYDSTITFGDPFFFRMAFSPVARLTLADPQPFDVCLDRWVEPLRRLVSLATGRTEQITYLSMSRPGDSERDDFQVYGSGLDQNPFASLGNDVRQIDAAFTARSEDISPLQILRGWQRLLDERHPLLETYGTSIIIPRQHPRSTYLLLIQALEGLYGHEHKAEYEERVQQHTAKRAEILDELAGQAGLPSRVIKFIKKYLMKKPHSGLDECLTEMFVSLPFDVREELAATGLIQEVQRAAGGPVPLPTALRTVRNDLSHGTKGYPTAQLHEAVEILDRVARAHMLRVLGCGTAAQERAARGSRF